MSRYDELGFFDFEDFVEELNEEELFSVNGGACGAGSSYNPTPHYGGSCAGGGAVTPSKPYTPPTPTCGGGYTNTSNNQGSFGYITNTSVKNAKMQDYEKIASIDNSMNGEGNSFSKKGCKMMGFAKILSAITNSYVSIIDINEKYDQGKDGLIGREEIGDAIRKNTNSKTITVDYWEKGLTKERLDQITHDSVKTYILGKAENVVGGDHWVVIEGYSTNAYGQIEFTYNGTSKNDVGRTFILGTPTSQQKNTYQITKIETFNVK